MAAPVPKQEQPRREPEDSDACRIHRHLDAAHDRQQADRQHGAWHGVAERRQTRTAPAGTAPPSIAHRRTTTTSRAPSVSTVASERDRDGVQRLDHDRRRHARRNRIRAERLRRRDIRRGRRSRSPIGNQPGRGSAAAPSSPRRRCGSQRPRMLRVVGVAPLACAPAAQQPRAASDHRQHRERDLRGAGRSERVTHVV